MTLVYPQAPNVTKIRLMFYDEVHVPPRFRQVFESREDIETRHSGEGEGKLTLLLSQTIDILKHVKVRIYTLLMHQF